MRRFAFVFLAVLIAALWYAPQSQGRGFRVNQIPNGTVNGCANCHINPAGGGARNPFGQLVGSRFLDNSGNVIWGPELAVLDADGDGFTNGQELQDPFGLWKTGDPAPGDMNLVSLPGDPASYPDLSASITVQFSGMTPHVGQMLQIRAIDKASGLEVARKVLDSIPAADFSVTLENLTVHNNYVIEFFADFNKNGLYDPPPTDHSWRVEADDIAAQEIVPFAHNTNFVTLDWNYAVTVDFVGMTPHVGQRFFIRLIEKDSQREVSRRSLASIPAADFSVTLPGLQPGKNYELAFFADHNGNGLYDPPTTDHAWLLPLDNVSGDTTVQFAHNTNFTDIGWEYDLTFQLAGMNPHVGQMFEARLLDADTQQELARHTVDAIPMPNFQVHFPVLTPGKRYQLDFYADFNGNKQYDAPPADHAWRITFSYGAGDTTVLFVHNTNFVDIHWPAASAVVALAGEYLPESFGLEQNYPNPFNPETVIPFRLARDTHVQLVVFNTKGQEVARLLDKTLPRGAYAVRWDGRDDSGRALSAGIYFYRLKTKTFTATRRMLLLK